MARRKGISNKSKSITSIRKTQQQLSGKAQQTKTQLIGNEERSPIKKESPVQEQQVQQQEENKMPPTQVPPSSPAPTAMMACTNNNNSGDLQNKYLHKKFKRASVAPATSENASVLLSAISAQRSSSVQEKPSAGQNSSSDVSTNAPTTQTARHVCPYCKLVCAKPSVLQKHIRAHTNERPYPCEPCGFAFKTKSNLYKHCRSRAHYQRMRGGTVGMEEDNASDADLSSSNASEDTPETPPPAAIQQANSAVNNATNNSAVKAPIYKPKFHKAALYRDENVDEVTNSNSNSKDSQHLTQTSISASTSATNSINASISSVTTNQISNEEDSLTRRISKIISQNEAIVDVVESPLLQRKYGKINTNSSSPAGSKLANALLRIEQPSNQPLNLSKPPSANDHNQQHQQQQQKSNDRMRQRRYSESQPVAARLDQHPQNPEGSIIKDLLLKARARGDAPFMLGDLPEDLGIGGSQYTCPLCRISFRGADNLETHRQYYCKGELNPAVGFQRSRSVNVQLPERYNPNTLAKLASSTLKAPPNSRRGQKPGDLRIVQQDVMADVTRVSAPLPSPGPLLGTTRLVASDGAPPAKRARTDLVVVPPTLRSLEDLCSSPLLRSQQQLGTAAPSLQMFGGEVRIVDDASGETKTLRIEPSSSQNSPAPVIFTPTSIIASPKSAARPDTPGRIVVRSGLHSGGTMLHNPPTTPQVAPLTPGKKQGQGTSHQPNVSAPDVAPNITHFRFPPVMVPQECHNNAPQTIVHGGRVIPFVPGIPGPNTPSTNEYNVLGSRASPASSPRHIKTPSPQTFCFPKNSTGSLGVNNTYSLTSSKITNLSVPSIKIDHPKHDGKHYIAATTAMSQTSKYQNGFITMSSRYNLKMTENVISSNAGITESMKELPQMVNLSGKLKSNGERSFNFTCIADNIDICTDIKSLNTNMEKIKTIHAEERHFNFENFISKSEIFNKSISDSAPNRTSTDDETNIKTFSTSGCTNTVSPTRTTETSYFRKNMDSVLPNSGADSCKSKFLRPSSLPLKPGTFTPKKHHGITPNAHTLPLISPETPRPAKAFGQLYLNGHAYTYLGLKCSTRVYYCTLNRLQPMYVANQHTLSMYSNWRVCSEACPNPLKMTPSEAMTQYDSRHRPQRVTIAKSKNIDILTHSSYWVDKNMIKIQNIQTGHSSGHPDETTGQEDSGMKHSDPSLTEGFESHEEYTYVRGRGRGKYVCSKCGIRCKKPSMLKKHARTHTDVRPFTCKHCAFSFKTKGNLTKHMKSKAHYKKCVELGINPVPTSVEEGDCLEPVGGSNESLGVSGDSDSDTDTDGDEGNEGETESSDTDESKSRLPEHEAAHCLLSLSSGRIAPGKEIRNITPGLMSSSRPCTYPYSRQKPRSTELNYEKTSPVVTITNSQQSSESAINETYKKCTLPNNVKLANSDKTEDVKSHCASQLPPQFNNNTNSLRQNSVIISNQQVITDDCYESMSDTFQPMDLTKPRDKMQIESRVHSSLRSIKAPICELDNEPMKVITNLVTSVSKPSRERPNFTRISDEHMFQAYLTEKALQETKIKQSQFTNNRIQAQIIDPNLKKMNPKSISCNTEMMNTVRVVTSVITQASSTAVTNVTFSRDPKTCSRIPIGLNESHILSNCSMDKSGMDTLAEIAACSSKLETNIDIINNITTDVSNNIKSATVNAKIVASEYLKITSEKSKNNEVVDEKNDVEITTKSNDSAISEIAPNDNADSIMNDSGDQKISSEHMTARKVVVGAGGLSFKLAGSANEFSATGNQFTTGRVTEDGRSVCFVCSKTFSKPSQLRLHINIHYFERPFRCEACAVSFRTKGHLQKHERSVAHHNKVSMASTFGAPTTSNPRPFNCSDCKVAFRIHGHLAKHLRSKMHVMRLECLGKLPFGTYAEIERAGVSLTDIDTTDCDNSLASLQILAQKLHEKDPTKQGAWDPITMAPPLLPEGESDLSEGEPMSPQNSAEEFPKKSLDSLESLKTIDNLNSCNICTGSFKTIKELEVHTFLEHNVQRTETSTVDNATSPISDTKRKCDDIDLFAKGMDNKRSKVTDS